MKAETCKYCGGEFAKVWTNKKQQRSGKCGACGKPVYIGKAEQSAGETGKEEQQPRGEAALNKKTASTPVTPTRSSGRRAASGSGDGGKEPSPLARFLKLLDFEF